MSVAKVNCLWAASSLPRSQVRDLYSSPGSFCAYLMSADTPVHATYPNSALNNFAPSPSAFSLPSATA